MRESVGAPFDVARKSIRVKLGSVEQEWPPAPGSLGPTPVERRIRVAHETRRSVGVQQKPCAAQFSPSRRGDDAPPPQVLTKNLVSASAPSLGPSSARSRRHPPTRNSLEICLQIMEETVRSLKSRPTGRRGAPTGPSGP